jgi:hypothetical protein
MYRTAGGISSLFDYSVFNELSRAPVPASAVELHDLVGPLGLEPSCSEDDSFTDCLRYLTVNVPLLLQSG